MRPNPRLQDTGLAGTGRSKQQLHRGGLGQLRCHSVPSTEACRGRMSAQPERGGGGGAAAGVRGKLSLSPKEGATILQKSRLSGGSPRAGLFCGPQGTGGLRHWVRREGLSGTGSVPLSAPAQGQRRESGKPWCMEPASLHGLTPLHKHTALPAHTLPAQELSPELSSPPSPASGNSVHPPSLPILAHEHEFS